MKKNLCDTDLRGQLPDLVDKMVQALNATPKTNHIDRYSLPSRKGLLEIVEELFSLVFPGYVRRDLCQANLPYFVGSRMDRVYVRLREEISTALLHETERSNAVDLREVEHEAEARTMAFLQALPEVCRLLETDVQAAFDGDPAARNYTEIVFAYPGFQAVAIYRMAHVLWQLELPLIARFLTEHAHGITGIDIHPGATIDESFFIDHGTGVVIGETSLIGKRVQMYHGVTLGAFSPRKGQSIRGQKRHPTIEDEVTIYPSATILGGDTVVGRGSVIGGNVWLTHSVEPGHRVMLESVDLKIKPIKD